MMGSVERGVSICFTTLPAFVRQVRVSQRDRLAHRLHGTIRASPFQAKVLFLLLAALVRLGLAEQGRPPVCMNSRPAPLRQGRARRDRRSHAKLACPRRCG